jgi:hypothetical protein
MSVEKDEITDNDVNSNHSPVKNRVYNAMYNSVIMYLLADMFLQDMIKIDSSTKLFLKYIAFECGLIDNHMFSSEYVYDITNVSVYPINFIKSTKYERAVVEKSVLFAHRLLCLAKLIDMFNSKNHRF